MPHLSPMNWIMSITIFWMSLTLLMSSFWWSDQHLFNTSLSHNNLKTEESWNWSLQDGRD